MSVNKQTYFENHLHQKGLHRENDLNQALVTFFSFNDLVKKADCNRKIEYIAKNSSSW